MHHAFGFLPRIHMGRDDERALREEARGRNPHAPSLGEEETTVSLLSPLCDPVGKGVEEETRDRCVLLFLEWSGILSHKTEQLLRRPVHGPQRPWIRPSRGFFSFSPSPEEVEFP